MIDPLIKSANDHTRSDRFIHSKHSECVYLDYHASTPLDQRVLLKITQSLQSEYGNPHSINHKIGRDASNSIENSKEQIAACLNIFPEEIVFTSGATEANNLAIIGLASGLTTKLSRIITISTEHKSVLEPLNYLKNKGYFVEILEVRPDGTIDLDSLESSLKSSDLSLVSISAANGEIGTIHPLDKISELCKIYGAYWHCDGTQAVGRIPLDISNLSIDLFTFSAHKICGPKGIGALIINTNLKPLISPIILGGGQQSGLRAGTLPTFLCVGIGEACSLARECLDSDNDRIKKLRDKLMFYLIKELGARLNGSISQRLSNNINISFPGIRALDIIANSPDLAISTGAACSSAGGVVSTSHVLRAITSDNDTINGSIRISVGRFSTEEDISRAIISISKSIQKLRD